MINPNQMKKLLLILCLLPFTGLAQTAGLPVYLPKFGLDSATKMRVYRLTTPVPGSKKDKLAAVLSQWFGSAFTATNNVAGATNNDTIKLYGEGNFTGSYVAAYQTRDPGAADKQIPGAHPVEYKIRFKVAVTVTDEKYAIALSDVTIDFFNIVTPLEEFYTSMNFLNIPIPGEDQGIDIAELYRRLFNDVNIGVQRVVKDASKCIAKAQKKGAL